MPTPLNLPPLGENIDGGDVVKVLVKAGDVLRADQPILELETGKATLEVPSPVAGTVGAVLVKPGDKIVIGQPVLMLADAGAPAARPATAPAAAAAAAIAKPASPPKPAPAPAATTPVGTELKLPSLGENVEGGDVVKVLVKAGDTVAVDQPLLEMETGKATVEVPSPAAGTVAAVLVKPGAKLKIGDPVLTWTGAVASAARAVAPSAPEPAAPAPVRPQFPPVAPEPAVAPVIPTARPSRVPVAAAPSVRQLAREIGVAIEEVKGSGAAGRITIDDVKRHSRQVNTGRKIHTHCALEAAPLPDFSKWGAVDRETMSKIRVATAEHMARAWATIPHVTQHDKADITQIESLRKRFAPRAEAAGGKLTVTAILLKVVAAALKVFPKFNASVDMAGRTVVYKKFYNVGVAVDTERGLLVPVLRGVDRKNIVQLAVELGEISKKTREGKIAPDDLQGGTFTITNLGAIGGSFFTPIINAPEVAILGVGRAAMESVCNRKDATCAPRLMMPLSLSYDHRLIDGADGARFLRWIVEAIEEPMLISLEG
ncbi:MAG: dihydrolipoyllysine-residue acetyltransferase [Lentisphaerae bacterium]|nr:dihydrolipoyllysine-residue acetyltransferase [Lentisphaerota bacterium]